jgi:hypothetical protein
VTWYFHYIARRRPPEERTSGAFTGCAILLEDEDSAKRIAKALTRAIPLSGGIAEPFVE